MTKKALIVEVPARYLVVMNGKIVDFGKTKFNAVTRAEGHGATDIGDAKWNGRLQFK